MFLSQLSVQAVGLDLHAFVASYPRPALVLPDSFGRLMRHAEDSTPFGELHWMKTDHAYGSEGETIRTAKKSAVEAASLDARRLTWLEEGGWVSFLHKSTRNPFTGMVIVGRQARSDVVVPLPGVSKVHAIFMNATPDGSWTVLDQRSSNGTMLNGKELKRGRSYPLSDGDRLVLGMEIEATFRLPASVFADVEAYRRGHLERDASARRLASLDSRPAPIARSG